MPFHEKYFILIALFASSNASQTLEHGQEKVGKVSDAKKSHMEGHLATNMGNWQKVSDMIGYKESIREAVFSK